MQSSDVAPGILEQHKELELMLMHIEDVQTAVNDNMTRLGTSTAASMDTTDTTVTTTHASTAVTGAISVSVPTAATGTTSTAIQTESHALPSEGGTDRMAADTYTPDELEIWQDYLSSFNEQVDSANTV